MRGTWLYCFAIAATLILAATLRITSTDTSRAIVLGDETTYWYAGQSIANYGVLTREVDGAMFRGEVPLEPTLRLSPGYPVFIAALGSVAPGSTEAVLASNIVLSIASLVLMLLVMHRLNLKRWAICTVLALAAVYPGFIYNLDRMLTEQLFVALLLSFVWVALIGIQSGKLWPLMVAGMLLALTTHVRAQALPFLLVAVVFILIMQPREKWLRQIIALVGTFAVFMAPWWVRNFATFGRFVLLTDADQGAAIWGAVPYFIDMGSSHGTLAEVVARNMPPNEAVYYRWRVFGFLQFMWGDVWDERQVHPLLWLRPFLLLQPLVVVPALLAIPLIALRARIDWLFVASIPLVITVCSAPYHGLPRYAFPAIPFALIAIGMLPSLAGKGATKNLGLAMVRYGFLAASIVLAALVAFSVYVFPDRMAREMSEYRLSRYLGVTLDRLDTARVVDDRVIDLSTVPVENVTRLTAHRYRNEVDAPPIIKLDAPRSGGKVVTEVTLQMKGGFLYDYTTIYWKGAKTADFSENGYYRVPTNPWRDSVTVYIDDDVDGLMIVPYVFRWATFEVRSARIRKYNIDDLHPETGVKLK